MDLNDSFIPWKMCILIKTKKMWEGLKIYQQRGALKCTNGSDLKIIGYTVLPVSIGNNVCNAKLTMVQIIFPKIIIGMQ